MLDKEEFKLHREKIMENVANKAVMVLFARRPSEFKSLPDKNFYYATGIKENDDIVFIVKGNDKVETTILVSEYDEFKAKWVGCGMTKEEAIAISGADSASYLNNFDTILNNYIGLGYDLMMLICHQMRYLS